MVEADRDAPWRSGAPVQRALPAQGWKLHVSATILTAPTVLDAIGPVLAEDDAHYKGAASLRILKQLNCGLFFGYAQIGKAVTVYPAEDSQASRLAGALDAATAGFDGPAVPFETPVRVGSSVFVRYGSFGGHADRWTVEAPDGELVPDDRRANPEWAPLPPGLVPPPPPLEPGPLRRRFRVYEALVQRGKGGVYRALDLTPTGARRCILKEGRAHGEVDLDASDGRSRVLHEQWVLTDLRHKGLPVPEVYAAFEEGGNAYLVMEDVAGACLRDVVHGPEASPTTVEALRLGAQAADLLARIHAAGWVWRDLKPANLIATGGRLRALDFEGAAPTAAPTAIPWATAGYAPPEWLTLPVATTQQDCYALGVTVHEIYTGALRTTDEPPALADLATLAPGAVVDLVAGLIHPDPHVRPSAAHAATVLNATLVHHELGTSSRPRMSASRLS